MFSTNLGLHLLKMIHKLMRISLHESDEPAGNPSCISNLISAINLVNAESNFLSSGSVIEKQHRTCGSTQKYDL